MEVRLTGALGGGNSALLMLIMVGEGHHLERWVCGLMIVHVEFSTMSGCTLC